MDIKKKKIIRGVLIVVFIILLLLLTWLLLGGKSFAKYQKEVEASGSLIVAKPIFKVEGAEDIKINGIEDTVYHFSIKNYEGLEVSEVDLNYNIQITNHSEVDLEFILTKDGQAVPLEENQTKPILLSGLMKQQDNYELKIKYHDNPAMVEDMNGTVQIKVEAIQAENNKGVEI